ncbi:aquaporin-12-like [Rhinatrema bivittatum]|uniref:aquaporin-12-like n=1 Tax=Rhinatrema bivittatum TaxID=194408 RepID=UPI00112D7306|nr:aquaporin-12-like [Rhinatrema bivittatum]
MAGLNILIAFFASIVVVCEIVRQISKKFLPTRLYNNFARELVCSLQLCACCLELRMLVEIGPWGGGFGADVVMTLLFLLFLVHGASFDGASANSAVSLQEFLLLESSFMATTGKLLAQIIGMEIAKLLTNYYWSWELTDFHLIQNLMAQSCSSSIQISLSHGIFVEGLCALFFHLALQHLQHSRSMYRVPALALTVTILVNTAGPYTGAFFNPTLAYSLIFHCSGNTLQEYILVYWMGPLTGMILALFLYQGNIPRLFERNLIYCQKSKYRTPKGKTVQVPRVKQDAPAPTNLPKKPSIKGKVEANQKRAN